MRKRRVNSLDTKRLHVQAASDAFLRAAAVLTEWPQNGSLAFALLEAVIGLRAIASADTDESAKELVVGMLKLVTEKN